MSRAFACIEREYKDAKGRVEVQRRVVEQLHMVEANAGDAEASLNALLEDEASKLRILDFLRKWLGNIAQGTGEQVVGSSPAGATTMPEHPDHPRNF